MKSTHIKSTIFFLILYFIVQTSIAQSFSISKDTIQIKEVVVTGTPVKVTRNNVPMSVSVVNRTQIEETNESAILPILNGRVPGLFVTERGVTGFGVAAGSAGQISIRGIGGNPTTGVLMLIDGHPQFMGIMGHPLPDSYVASDVERVEVIRGPASILYGSNAMGGVINIITRKQHQNGLNGNAKVSYGSFNTQKYMGAMGFKKEKLSTFVSINHDRTDGHRPNSDFQITNAYLKLGYDLNEHFSASTDFSVAAYKAADPGPDTLNASPGERIDITRGYWAFTLLNEFEKVSGAVKLFYNFGEHNITDGFHSKDKNFGFNLYEAFNFFKGNTITAGIDLMNYGGMAENVKAMNGAGIQFADTTITEYGIYTFSQQELGKLMLNAGLRFQHHSQYGSIWIPSFGFAYQLKEQASWKGNVSKGFRSPTMRELFMWGPNPDLDPETVWSYETGILSNFFNNTIHTELTLFMVEGDNLIVNAGPPLGYQNSGEVKNKGVELALKVQPFTKLAFNATYSYTNMKTPVFATPEHHLFISTNYEVGKLRLNADLKLVSNLDNNPSPVINQVSYTLLNAKALYQLTKNINVYLSGENLTDIKYEVNHYYTMPGITFFAGTNLRF